MRGAYSATSLRPAQWIGLLLQEHLGRMEEAGLITRKPKSHDKRALEVWLTDKGWVAAEHVALCGHEVDEVACAGMTEKGSAANCHTFLHDLLITSRKQKGRHAHE